MTGQREVVGPSVVGIEDRASLASVLLDWHRGGGPLYLQLADAVTEAIARRRLQPGDKVPPERVLAAQLNVGRNTVIRAYETLRERGLLESRRGSGSWVAASASSLALANATLDGLSDAAPAAEQVTIDLATASFGADDAVLEELLQIPEPTARRLLEGAGYSDTGLRELREAIAAGYADGGLPTSPDQILVTSGAQQSISLIARRFLAVGDVVVVEEPTSAGALDIFSESQAVVRAATGAAVDSVDDVLDAVARARPTLVYLSLPGGVHGGRLEAAQLERLGEHLGRQQSLIVEDAGAYDLDARPAPHLASVAVDSTVLTLGSMSKLYWGGLRIGWIRGPEPLIEGLARTKARADLGTSILPQYFATRLLARREEIRERRLAHLAANLEIATRVLRDRMPELQWQPPDAGPAIWARMPFGSVNRFVRHAHDHGVRVAAGEVFSPSGRSNDRLRISLAPDPVTLAEGLRRLADAWKSFPAIGDSAPTSNPGRIS